MSNKWLKWAKECEKGREDTWNDKKKNKAIEDFIKWLKLFYKSNEKEKNLILIKLKGENEALYKFVNDLKDIGECDQKRLYEQLRGNFI